MSTPSSEQAPNGTTPGATPETGQTAPTTPPAQNAAESDNGKGSKAAVLADLAKERDERQALQTRVEEMSGLLNSLKAVFGVGAETPLTPEQMQAKIAESESTAKTAQIQLAVLKAADTKTVDVTGLLDSGSFQSQLKNLDISDESAVKKLIADFVAANPRFRAMPIGAGAGDAGAGNPPPAAGTMNDWIRSQAHRG